MERYEEVQIFDKNVGVESFFIRAINELEKNGIWLKFTFLKVQNKINFRVWVIYFNEFKNIIRTKTYPLHEISEEESVFLFPDGYVNLKKGSHGEIDGLSWDISWDIEDDRPIKLLPDFLYSNKLPNTKLYTPFPRIFATGKISINNSNLICNSLNGMIGHNWGQKHSREYNWFSVSSNMFYGEGFNLKIFGIPFTSICIRHEDTDYMFSDIFNISKINSKTNFMEWFVYKNSDYLKLSCIGNSERAVKLNYHNSDGTKMKCVNDNLAKIYITIKKGDDRITDVARGSLEFLRKSIIW